MNRRTTKLKTKYSHKGLIKSCITLRVILCIGLSVSVLSFTVFYYSYQQDPGRISSSSATASTSFNEAIIEYISLLSSYLFWSYTSPADANNDLYSSKLRSNDSKLPLDSLTITNNIFNNISISQSPLLTAVDECLNCGEQELSFLTVARVQYALSKHPFRHITFQHYLNHSSTNGVFTLISYIKYLYKQPACRRNGVQLPVFVSMANVFSDLYWQLIENFIYTMVKFGLSSCSMMVCVSDASCMRLCEQYGFPCYDFQYSDFHPGKELPSVLEQIGELKLLHLPKVLEAGVDILILDLDVGFMDSPLKLLDLVLNDSSVDVLVQKDISFVMYRDVVRWRTWLATLHIMLNITHSFILCPFNWMGFLYTVPLPNIGIFYCRGNDKTAAMFELAWKDYVLVDSTIKVNPGKDQNKVVSALHEATSYLGLKWRYVPEHLAVLLDKIYKFENKTYELGGEAAQAVMNSTIIKNNNARRRRRGKKGGPPPPPERGSAVAAHTTCYEQKTKMMGLKASNAFWNPFYFDTQRRTLTKPLLYLDGEQLRFELRSLLYLAIVSNRSLIVPNVLGDKVEMAYNDLYRGKALWPGFRTPYIPDKFPWQISVLEPSFYWRMARDFSDSSDRSGRTSVPSPSVLAMAVNRKGGGWTLPELEEELLSQDWAEQTRVVLHMYKIRKGIDHKAYKREAKDRLSQWASDSVGTYRDFEMEKDDYGKLPRLYYHKTGKYAPRNIKLAYRITQDIRLCDDIFEPDKGNRSCFNKCK